MMVSIVGIVNFFKSKFGSLSQPKIGCCTKPRELGSKKAFLVGINNYKPELNSNLRGCVNDIENVRSFLITYFGFDPANIRVVIDERATREAIVERLTWLINTAVSGDELLFHFSGHGSQVVCREGDELSDGLDELLCPYDLDWNNPLTDDVIGSIISKLPSEVFFTMVSDSCHSGSVSRAVGADSKNDSRPRRIIPPFDIRCRSLDRKISRKRSIGTSVVNNIQNHVLLSACRDDQTAADAYIEGKYQGMLTWALTQVINSNPKSSWNSVYANVLQKIGIGGQIPQLSGKSELLDRPMFGGTVK